MRTRMFERPPAGASLPLAGRQAPRGELPSRKDMRPKPARQAASNLMRIGALPRQVRAVVASDRFPVAPLPRKLGQEYPPCRLDVEANIVD